MSDISDVARYILSKSSITHRKLQRLCYYCQAWYLANYGRPMFSSRFEAWVHGPVSPDLYMRYKEWGNVHISKVPANVKLPDAVCDLIDKVLEVYGGYTEAELCVMSKCEYPWLHARKGCSLSGYSRNPISMRDMRLYYGRRIGKSYNDCTISSE